MMRNTKCPILYSRLDLKLSQERLHAKCCHFLRVVICIIVESKQVFAKNRIFCNLSCDLQGHLNKSRSLNSFVSCYETHCYQAHVHTHRNRLEDTNAHVDTRTYLSSLPSVRCAECAWSWLDPLQSSQQVFWEQHQMLLRTFGWRIGRGPALHPRIETVCVKE